VGTQLSLRAAPPVRLFAPAKLTVSLAVVGRRADGYHELSAEMVSIDLADELEIDADGHGLDVEGAADTRAGDLSVGPDNLVLRALESLGRRAGVHLVKKIPVRGGLGGGSSDAAAVLRWGGCDDLAVAASLGADVPFCLVGGRARVEGIGEQVMALPFEPRSYVLLMPPFGVDTARVFAAFDDGAARRGARNELTAAAQVVEPRLAAWGERLGEASGRDPEMAGSGSTWFVDGEPSALGLAGCSSLRLGDDEAALVAVRTVPAEWSGP